MSSLSSTDFNRTLAEGSSQSLSGSYNSAKKRNHPFYVFGLFDIFAHAETDSTSTYAVRDSHTTIVTSGFDNSGIVEYAIKASSYGASDIMLCVDGVYFLGGRLIALNKAGMQSFHYNSEHRLLSTKSNSLEGDLTNNSTVVGLGIILSRDTTPNVEGKPIVICKILHTDYNPDSKSMSNFIVEYQCQPTRVLEKMQSLFQKGREVQVTGYIVGWSQATFTWVVDVTGVSLTTGSENSASASLLPGTTTNVQTPSGRNRNKMFVIPGAQAPESNAAVSDLKNTPPAPSPSANKNKRPYTRRLNVKFPKEVDAEETGNNSGTANSDHLGIDAQGNALNHLSDEEMNSKRPRSGF